MVIADETVDAEMCATDLLGQAEHEQFASRAAYQFRATLGHHGGN